MDSKEQLRTERRGGLLSRLRPGEPEGPREGIEGLLRAVKSYNAKADLKEIERAFRFAEEHHAGQTRLSGEPFIQHPLSVAQAMSTTRTTIGSFANLTGKDLPTSIDATRTALKSA